MTRPPTRRQLGEKVLDQRRLAAAGFARDAHDQPAPCDGGLEPLAQRGALLLVADRAAPGGGRGRAPQLLRRDPFPRGRLDPQPLGEVRDCRLGPGAQLLADRSLVCAAVVQRIRNLTERGERGHEAERGSGAEWIERGELAPPLHRGAVVEPRGSVPRQGFERGAHARGEPTALHRGPALELVHPVYIKAVQERSGVECDRAGQVALLQSILERLDVARENRGVQPELGPAE